MAHDWKCVNKMQGSYAAEINVRLYRAQITAENRVAIIRYGDQIGIRDDLDAAWDFATRHAAGGPVSAKIRHRGVFIERQGLDATGYKYICHTGIDKFLPDLYDSQEQAVEAVDAKLNDAPKAARARKLLERIAGEVVKPDSPETLSFQKLTMESLKMPDEVLARIADILDTPETEH